MRGINKGQNIILNSLNHGQTYRFRINNGGSCVTYEVTYSESDNIVHNGILKEYCPLFIELEDFPLRDKEGALIIHPDKKGNFLSGLNNFKATYERINQYLFSNRSAINYHTAQIGLFEGLNTLFTLTALDHGCSLEKIESKSVCEVMRIALSVTKAVEMYHRAGYLHLDIKPQNIFILDGVTDLIKLFDFDSLTEIEKLKNGQVDYIPVPNEYYVPELNQTNTRNIGIQTDIFEIGALIFERLFGRSPDVNDMKSSRRIDLDSSRLLQSASPKVKFEIEQLLYHTIQISKYNRYADTDSLKNQIQKIIDLTDGNHPYLIDMPKWEPSRFSVGRELEIDALKQHLDAYGFVFIKGMGGLGKSELSKLFAKRFADEYHTVQFCKYTGSLKAVIASLSVNGVIDAEYDDFEELVKYKNQILHQCDTHTLLIVDNFNVTYDEFMRDFLPSGNNSFRVIFTTRCEPAQEYYYDKVFEIDVLEDEPCKQVFYMHSRLSRTPETDSAVNELIRIIHSNTLVLVLLAKALHHSDIQLADVVEKMEQSEMEEINTEVFHEYDFSSIEGENYNRVFAHLNTIFNMNGLSAVQKEILLCLSLVSNIGIGIDDFISSCQNSAFESEDILSLLSFGWVEQEQPGWIALHPVISDLIFANQSIQRTISFDNLAYYIINECDAFGSEHIDTIHTMLSYLLHLDKRIGKEKEFRSIDVKTNLAKVFYYLYQPKDALKKYNEAEAIAALSFRYKPRLCRILEGKGEVEKDFGDPKKAMDTFQRAIHYCKKTVNYYYEEYLLSLTGIAECYVKLHDYNNAYKFYLEAYHYIYNDSLKDKLNSMIFVTNAAGTKSLEIYVPGICDDIISVCEELQLVGEVERFKTIKSHFEPEEDQFAETTELLKKGDIKRGVQLFFEQLDAIKAQFGEDSPAFKKIMSDVVPLLVLKDADESYVSLHQLTESISFIKDIYGEESVEFLDFIDATLMVLPEVGELEFSKDLALKGKKIAVQLGLQNSYYYQSFNASLIVIMQLMGQTDLLKNYVEEIDVACFESKSDLELLLKKTGIPLYLLGFKQKAVGIAQSVYQIQNRDTTARFVACLILSLNSIDNGEIVTAQNLLKESKDTISVLGDGFIKEEYLYLYYFTKAKCDFEQGNLANAVKTVDEYLNVLGKSEGFVLTMLRCRALNEKATYLRYMHNYKEAYETIHEALLIIGNNEVPELVQKAVYGNHAICSIYQELFEEGYDSVEKFMELYTDEQKIADLDYLNCIVFFIDALIVKHNKSFYHFIEEAEKIVEKGHFEKTFLNAMLENYIGVVLSDYEEEFGLAENRFNSAKELLEELGQTDNPLYSQIETNIKYASDKTMDKLIKEMAKFYVNEEDNEDE